MRLFQLDFLGNRGNRIPGLFNDTGQFGSRNPKSLFQSANLTRVRQINQVAYRRMFLTQHFPGPSHCVKLHHQMFVPDAFVRLGRALGSSARHLRQLGPRAEAYFEAMKTPRLQEASRGGHPVTCRANPSRKSIKKRFDGVTYCQATTSWSNYHTCNLWRFSANPWSHPPLDTTCYLSFLNERQ